MTAFRRTFAALLDAARGGASVLGALVVAGALAWLPAGRGSSGTGATTSAPPLVAATFDAPSPPPSDAASAPRLESPAVEASSPPGASVVTAAPTIEPTLEPTPRPTATLVPATPGPTPKPTPRPTPKPIPGPTAQPTHDPAPEPTPRLGTASGSFGQTLTVDGVTVRMDRRQPSQDPTIRCGLTDDPEMQGFTDVVSYDLRITWPDPADASEPWIAIGSTPFNVLWFDPTVRSGVDIVFSTCKRPADSFRAVVEFAPNGDPVLQRFTFS
ncbi:MAG TPA: hypothetical protein VM427_00340 [Patescibacteria group bacterium]|nr:hypothetical protein [Patescibacteria group bacterium]